MNKHEWLENVARSDATDGARAVAIALWEHMDVRSCECYPTQGRLARLSNRSARSVRDRIAELENLDLLEVESKKMDNGGVGRRYRGTGSQLPVRDDHSNRKPASGSDSDQIVRIPNEIAAKSATGRKSRSNSNRKELSGSGSDSNRKPASESIESTSAGANRKPASGSKKSEPENLRQSNRKPASGSTLIEHTNRTQLEGDETAQAKSDVGTGDASSSEPDILDLVIGVFYDFGLELGQHQAVFLVDELTRNRDVKLSHGQLLRYVTFSLSNLQQSHVDDPKKWDWNPGYCQRCLQKDQWVRRWLAIAGELEVGRHEEPFRDDPPSPSVPTMARDERVVSVVMSLELSDQVKSRLSALGVIAWTEDHVELKAFDDCEAYSLQRFTHAIAEEIGRQVTISSATGENP